VNEPRVVVVTRPTELEELLVRHGTRDQAAFFLSSRGQTLARAEQADRLQRDAVAEVLRALPLRWRRTHIARAELDRFLFEPDDLVIAVGGNGLVANVAKYLDGQPVIGVNSDPGAHELTLVRHPAQAAPDLLRTLTAGRARVEERTMVEARLDDGQVLRALNELFIGHRSHQSARYELTWAGKQENQSSSGMIVTTGTGATGWGRSVHRNRVTQVTLPAPDEPRLAFFVREAWPSVATGADLTDGSIGPDQTLEVVSRMSDGVAFGDGIESDPIELGWGRRLTVGLSSTRLRLVIG
jgi:NAD kinase